VKSKLEEAWQKYDVSYHKLLDLLPQELLKQCRRITYEPGECIINEGDTIAYIYFIESGIADGMKRFENGKDYQYFKLDKVNGAIGLLELFSRQRSVIATIVARTEVVILRVDAAELYMHVVENNELLLRYTFHIAKDLYNDSGKNGHLFYQNGLERLCFYLTNYYMSAELQDTVIVRQSYQTIANQIGVSIRTVGRAVQYLHGKGMCSHCGKFISIDRRQYERIIAMI